MSPRIVDGPEVISMIEELQDLRNRVQVTEDALRHIISAGDRGCTQQSIMQTLRNLLQWIQEG